MSYLRKWYFVQFGDGTRNGYANAGKYQKSPQVIVGKHKEKTCLKGRFSLLHKDIIFCSPSAVISRKRLTYAAFGGIIIKKHGGVRAIKFRRIL